MGLVFSLIAVLVLVAISWIGAGALGWRFLFGVVLPYAAIATFLIGVVMRVFKWARSPVPFRIPTSCGQQKSLSWIKPNHLENPNSLLGVIGRMALEVLFFRSLFRNTRADVKEGPRVLHSPDKWLWASSLAFHWSFLIVFIRHFKYFAEPVPSWVLAIQNVDGFFQIGLPILLATDFVILAAVTFLFLRRLFDAKVRYISLAGDYFPLLLILGIVVSGIWMRYLGKIDLMGVKTLGTGLLSFHPVVPDGIGTLFFVHLFLVTSLIAYFPFSKLVHFAGVFMSPTRNLVNNNRARRHVNPWNYPVKVHTYEEYEEEFHDVMKAADLPLEKE